MDTKNAFVALLQDLTATVRKLSSEQFDQVLSGHARIAFVPPGASVVLAGPDAGAVRAKLVAMEGRDAATDYLTGLKLKRADLLALAKQLNVAVLSKDNMSTIQRKIVDATAGTREDTAAIHSSGWRR